MLLDRASGIYSVVSCPVCSWYRGARGADQGSGSDQRHHRAGGRAGQPPREGLSTARRPQQDGAEGAGQDQRRPSVSPGGPGPGPEAAAARRHRQLEGCVWETQRYENSARKRAPHVVCVCPSSQSEVESVLSVLPDILAVLLTDVLLLLQEKDQRYVFATVVRDSKQTDACIDG